MSTVLDTITSITTATEAPLPKCFYNLAGALAGLKDVFADPHMPTAYKVGCIEEAIAAATQCVHEYGKSPEQREAEEGLDLCGYAGKWESAQAYVAEFEIDANTLGYWEAVRTHFLEIGGCYLSQMPTSDPRHPEHSKHTLAVLAAVIPCSPVGVPAKVRFA